MSKPKSGADLASRAAWQRWEMDSLQTLRSRTTAYAPGPGQATAGAGSSEVLRQRADALSQAREQGMAKGYQAGFEQGRSEGLAQGLEEGRLNGHKKGFEQGEREGRALGLRAGHEEGAKAAREQANRLQALADTCAQSLDTLEAEVGQNLIALAIRIAEQVVRTSLRDQPNQILDLVTEVLQSGSPADSGVQLRLHPDDIELVQEFLAQDTQTSAPRLLADERITRGGCVLETAQGAIDATLETRWRRVIAALGHGKP